MSVFVLMLLARLGGLVPSTEPTEQHETKHVKP